MVAAAVPIGPGQMGAARDDLPIPLHHWEGRLAGTVRKTGSVDDLETGYVDRLRVDHLDATEVTEVKAVVNRAFEAVGHIDVAVNNAGYGLFGSAEEVTDEQILEYDRVQPPWLDLGRARLPHLRAQGGGRIT